MGFQALLQVWIELSKLIAKYVPEERHEEFMVEFNEMMRGVREADG